MYFDAPDTNALNTLWTAISAVIGGVLVFLGSLAVARIQARAALRVAEKTAEPQTKAATAAAELSLSQIADSHLKTVLELHASQIRELTQANESKTKRIADDEERQRENMKRIDLLQEHSETCDRVLKQTERQLRMYDETLGVIRWEAGMDGNLTYVNKHFLYCTGFIEEELLGDSKRWLEAVRPRDLNTVEQEWDRLIRGYQTEIHLRFLFVHQSTQVLTPVEAEVETVFGSGHEVYRFTARTKPLYLINAELSTENKRLQEQNRVLIETNLQLIGRQQDEDSVN